MTLKQLSLVHVILVTLCLSESNLGLGLSELKTRLRSRIAAPLDF